MSKVGESSESLFSCEIWRITRLGFVHFLNTCKGRFRATYHETPITPKPMKKCKVFSARKNYGLYWYPPKNKSYGVPLVVSITTNELVRSSEPLVYELYKKNKDMRRVLWAMPNWKLEGFQVISVFVFQGSFIFRSYIGGDQTITNLW